MRTDNDYLAESVAEIKQLASALIVLNDRLKNRLRNLEEERIVERQGQVDVSSELNELEGKYEALKLAKAMKEEFGDDAKERVTKLMREIERCLDLVKRMS